MEAWLQSVTSEEKGQMLEIMRCHAINTRSVHMYFDEDIFHNRQLHICMKDAKKQ